MAKLEGIIYKAFENFVVFRGYAPIGVLAEVSKRPDAYQRTSSEEHKRDLIKFLMKKEYAYFPELILAYRGADLDGLINALHGKVDVEYDAGSYVKGLKVLRERVPASGYRARHAQLQIDKDTLLRVDGNHRLEPFDDDDNWWSYFIEEKAPEEYDDEQKAIWLRDKVREYTKDIRKTIVPFSIVISNNDIADKFEASIFNNINFKQLPLKQEKNIQNVYNYLKDSDELGEAHELTIKLIELTENGHFIGLPLFDRGTEDESYRTVCYKTAQLLLTQKQKLFGELDGLKKDKKELETTLSGFSKEKQDETTTDETGEVDKKIVELDLNIKNSEKRIASIEGFCTSIAPGPIEIAIQSLRPIYSKFGNNHGNISLFATMVYFKLLNEHKFVTFVDWVTKNGINKIPFNDELPTHNPQSLISLFERVYEAKGREIFVSMQFNDPQSEMIYEKVVQTIERFNREKGLDIKVSTIRIDQKVTTDLFTISKEISNAIESSSLIIADLSSHNINVYHEVGLAMGLAQSNNTPASVILLYKTDSVFRDKKECDEDHFVGFNLRGESQLRFQTYKQLVDGLFERLEKHYGV